MIAGRQREDAGTVRPAPGPSSAVSGAAGFAVALRGAFGRADLVLLAVLVLSLVARAVTAAPVVELLLGAHLILRSGGCLVGVVVAIPGTLGIDTGGNRPCRFGCVDSASAIPVGTASIPTAVSVNIIFRMTTPFRVSRADGVAGICFRASVGSLCLHHPNGRSRIKDASRSP